MMIIIDEYDSSVNAALLSREAAPFREYLELRTSVYFRFFTKLKKALQVPGNRALIVGVTPLAIADFTSGFNVAVDLTWKSLYQDVCGILVNDIKPVLKEIGHIHNWNKQRIVEVFNKLVNLYDGYYFGGNNRIFNSGQLVNCLQELYLNGNFPTKLTDVNTNLSEGVLNFLSKSQNNQFYQLLIQLLTKPVPFKLLETFVIEKVRDELDSGKPSTLLSLMVYYGALTAFTKDKVSEISAMCIFIFNIHCCNITSI